MIYPSDANGDVLRRLEAQGNDLSKPRNIDFTVVFAEPHLQPQQQSSNATESARES